LNVNDLRKIALKRTTRSHHGITHADPAPAMEIASEQHQPRSRQTN
jgi:hypothetical protein